MENVKDNNNLSTSRGGRGDYRVTNLDGSSTYVRENTDTYLYDTKIECLKALVCKMDRYPATRDNVYDNTHNYTVAYNSWIMATGYDLITESIKSYAKRDGREAYVQYTKYGRWETREGFLEYQACKADASKKIAFNKACWFMFYTIRRQVKMTTTQSNQESLVPRVQMENVVEKTSEQGSTNQESDKKINTIITRDQLQTESRHMRTLNAMSKISTSEPTHIFPTLVERWMPMDPFEISINDKTGTLIKTYYLPEDLYKSCAPNMLPMETFIYGLINTQIRGLTNANKFHCGKICISSKYDSHQVDAYCGTLQAALMRPHVIIDLTANNEAVLDIPFRYHNQFIRLLNKDASKGVRTGKYCSVYVHVLSPLTTGPDGPSSIGARLYYRLNRCEFAGMTYRIPTVQMDGVEKLVVGGALSVAKPLVHVAANTASSIVDELGVEDIIHNVANISLKEQIKKVEEKFDQLGSTFNQDKPGKFNATLFIPKPKLNFCTGKGSTDVIPMRINPNALTNMVSVNIPKDEPKSFYDLARIWGLFQAFKWKNTDKEGDVIYSQIIDPFLRTYDKTYEGVPTPYEFAVGHANLVNATEEWRFDFVSNSYHTGTVQIHIEYGRSTNDKDICQSSSTYTKVFHLGEQKSVTMIVPYIYDTPFRRDTGNIANPYLGEIKKIDMNKDSLSVAPESKTKIKMTIINPLRPVSSAPKTIEVLVFKRAGENFVMHGLKPSAFVTHSKYDLDLFPEKYATTVVERLDASKHGYSFKKVRDSAHNKWNEYSSSTLSAAHVQMDNGEKEDLDRTDNFNHGKCALLTLTNDCHMDFKDILRRPVMIINGYEYQDKAGVFDGFFLPKMPPQKAMSPKKDSGDKGIYDAGIMFNATTSIVNMHRFFRGGDRWTILAVPLGNKYEPIFISSIPHSGSRIIGPHTLTEWKANDGTKSRNTKMKFYSHGYVTEVICPNVNNMITFETPYETELPWTLIHEDNEELNYAWREKGSNNSGHIVINSKEKVRLYIWWGAADDYTLAGFLGIPTCINDTNQYRDNDTHGKVQMDMEDFPFQEGNTTVLNFFKRTGKSLISKKTLRYGLALVPGIGSGLVAASAANDVDEGIQEVKGSVQRTACKIEQVANKFDVTVDAFSNLLNQAASKLTDTLGSLVSGVSSIYDVILDIFIAWSTHSWVPIGVGIVRFLGKMYIGTTEVVGEVLSAGLALSNWISNWCSDIVPRVQAPDTPQATLTGILCGIVGTLLGVRLDSRRTRPYMSGLAERLTSSTGISYFVGVLRFVQGIFSSIKELVLEALGYVSPESVALKMFKEKNEIISKFIDEAQLVTSEANTSMLGLPSYRRRFWKVVLQAYQIQKLICQLPNNMVSGQLAKLCCEVIKIANEKFLDLAASPVRYEPFVIFLEGEPGMGKSYVSESFAKSLLDSIGYNPPASGIVYQRTSGEKFWSGYRDQPVVVYDEFLNSNDSQRCMDFIVEFQKLKSTCTFIPEMAHLEEKKIRGNPLIVFVLCNNAFPNLSDYARYPEAILRRRDLILKVTRTPGFENKNLRDEDRQVVGKFQHLQYQMYVDPKDCTSLTDTTRGHGETLLYVTKLFANWHTTETLNVQDRMKMLPSFIENQEDINLDDPFTLFYTATDRMYVEGPSQNIWTPFEKLQTAVDMLDNVILQHQARQSQPVVIPEKPSWEDLVSTTQAWTGFVAGFLTTCTPLSWIANMSYNQLEHLESTMTGVAFNERECCVCYETKVCDYACSDTFDKESQHNVCLQCVRSLRLLGNGKCPMCRCDVMLPLLNTAMVTRFSVWRRMALIGCKSMKWFFQKIASFYQWRRDHGFVSLITDHIINIIYMVLQILQIDPENVDPNLTIDATSYGAMIGRFASAYDDQITSFVNRNVSFVQVDWPDNPEERLTHPHNSDGIIDELDVLINDGVIERYNNGFSEAPICLHHLLRHNKSLLRMDDEGFLTLDEETQRFVRVPFYQCQQRVCLAMDPTFVRRIINDYRLNNRLALRQLNIDYINNPCQETLMRIPEVFRRVPQRVEMPNISDSWWEHLSNTYQRHKTLLMYLGGAALLIGGVASIYRMVNRTITTAQTDGGLMGSPGEQSPRHRRVHLRERQTTRYFQSEEAPSVLDTVKRYIVRNTVKFTLGDGHTGKIMYGVGLFKHYVLLPKHYTKVMLAGLAENKSLFIEPEGKPQLRTMVDLKMSDITFAKDVDAAYMKVPTCLPLFKDLLKFFALDEDLDKPLSNEAELMMVPGRQRDFFSIVPVELEGVEPSRIIVDTDESSFVAKDVLVYNYSKPGACGSLLLRDHHQRPILSMHFAGAGLGHDGKGYGIILTQQALKPLSDINTDVVQFEDVEYGPIEEAQFVYDDSVALNYMGSVPKEKVPFIPSKSRLEKSLIFGKPGLQVDVAPAILDKKDERYIHQATPLYAGVKKHGIITKNFSNADLLWARTALWDNRYARMLPLVTQPKVLTEDQAICGLPIDYYKKMDLDTSAGYDYIIGTKKKKSDFIEVEVDEQLRPIKVKHLHEKVRQRLDRNRELRKQGIIPQQLYVDMLKDEKRKIKKLMTEGGTRVFCNGPLDQVIEDRMYYMHFVAAFMKHRFDLGHAVGINPLSSEWTALTNKLLKHNSEFMTIDYSNFGPGYNAGVAEQAYEIIVQWTLLNVARPPNLTQEEYERTLRALVWTDIQSHHICSNTVYHQVAGSPSGSFFTTIVNSIVNQLYILLAWKNLLGDIVKKQGKSIIKEFFDNVELFVYGDDGIFTVSDKYKDMFNMQTIVDYFSKYNICATGASKDQERVKSEGINKATFLKRGFKRHPTRDEWLSPLNWDSILSATQWVWKSANMREATLVNAQAALLQAHGHGPEKYNILKDIINTHLRNGRMPLVVDQWHDLDELFYEGKFIDIDTYINF